MKKVISAVLSAAMLITGLPVFANDNADEINSTVTADLPWQEEEVGAGEIAEPAEINYPDAVQSEEQEVPVPEPIVHTEEIKKDVTFPEEEYNLLSGLLPQFGEVELFSAGRTADDIWDNMFSQRYGEEYLHEYMQNGDGINVSGDTNRLVVEETDLTLPGKNGLDLTIKRRYDSQASRKVVTFPEADVSYANEVITWYYVYTYENIETGEEVKVGFETEDLMYKYAYDGFIGVGGEAISATEDGKTIRFYRLKNIHIPSESDDTELRYERRKEIPCQKVMYESTSRAGYDSYEQFYDRDYLGTGWSLVLPEAAAIGYNYDYDSNDDKDETHRYTLSGIFKDINGNVHSFSGTDKFTFYGDDTPDKYESSYSSKKDNSLRYESIFDPTAEENEHMINGRYYNFVVYDNSGLTYYFWDNAVKLGDERPVYNRQMYIIAVADEYGNMIQYYYDDEYTVIEKIVDTYGREITFQETDTGSVISYYDDQDGKTKTITYKTETLPESELDNDSIIEMKPVNRFTVTNEEGEETIYDSRIGQTISYYDGTPSEYSINMMPEVSGEQNYPANHNNLERIIYPNGDEQHFHYNDIYKYNDETNVIEGIYAVDSSYEVIDGVVKNEKNYTFATKYRQAYTSYDIVKTCSESHPSRITVSEYDDEGMLETEEITTPDKKGSSREVTYTFNDIGSPLSIVTDEDGYVSEKNYTYIKNYPSMLKSETDGLRKTEYSYHTVTQGGKEVLTDKASTISYMQNTGDDEYAEVYRVETDLTSDGKGIARERTVQNGKTVAQVEYDYDSEGNVVETRQWTDDANGDGVLNIADDPITVTSDHETTAQKTRNETVTSDEIVNADGVNEGNVTFDYEYNIYGSPVSQTDSYGTKTEIEYDALGRPVKFYLPNGGTEQISYDMDEGAAYMTNAAGITMKYIYDCFGRLQAVYRSNGSSYDRVMGYSYSDRGMLSFKRQYTSNSSGVSESYEYDIFDRLSSKIAYDIGGGTLYSEIYTYKASDGNQIVTKTVLDHTVSSAGKLAYTEKDTYDKYGRLIKQELHDGDESIVKEYEYDYADRVTKETDGNGGVTLYEYNYAGQVTKQTNALGDSVTTVYDMAGRELSVTDAKGNTSTTDYDKLGRAIKAITPFNSNTGGEVKTYYDKNSNTVKTAVKRSSSLYSTTEYKYDVMGNNVAEITENGDSDIVTQYEYDVAGRVMKMITGLTEYSETPAGGAVTQYEYNNSGFVSKVTDPMGGVETYNEYDHAGNVLSVTDRNSNTIRNTYSAYGLKKSRSESSPETKEYTYDGLGHVIKSSSVNKDGETVEETYSYDGLGRLTLSTGNNGDTQSYSYDSNSNLMSYELNGEGENEVSYEYDALNRLTKLTNNGIITTYEYDENGNLLKKEQDNGVSTEYVYNDAGLVTSMEVTKGSDIYTYSECEYLLNGLIKTAYMPYVQGSTYETRTKHYNYDLAGRLTGEYTANAAGVPLSNSYSYDANGNRIGMNANKPDDAMQETVTYEYDLNNRLINENSHKSYEEHGVDRYKNTRYYYDGNGNMTAKQSWGSDTASDSETVSSEADVTGYAEDSGTAVYRYDAFGRLTDYNTTSMVVSYKYNADNLRTQKTVNGTETRYVWNGENLAGEYGGSSGIYTYDGQGIHISNKDGVIKTYLKDQHGSIVGYADEDGALIDTGDHGMDYDAFGNQWTGEAPDPFGYSGEYHDSETGLIYLRNRYYDSSTGRFITEDPAKDGVNWYSYCGGDPVNMVDPWGLTDAMLRYIVEKNGGSIDYDPNTGSSVINMPDFKPMTLSSVSSGKITVSVDGQEDFEISARVLNGRIVVDSQFMMDNFGLSQDEATHQSNDPFTSLSDAVVGFGLTYHPESKSSTAWPNGCEYGTFLYDNGDGTFSFGDVPNPIAVNTCDLGNLDTSRNLSGWIHTHPNPGIGFVVEEFSGNAGGGGDGAVTNYYNVTGYLVAPSGTVSGLNPTWTGVNVNIIPANDPNVFIEVPNLF